MFVSLDGLDGAGKSTQCRRLADWLRGRGRDVVECADPGGTHVGQVVRDVLLDPAHPLCLPAEALLFMASRAQLVDEVIRPALTAGRTVVSDRYLLANVVYQGHAGGLDPQLLWTVGRLAIGDVTPDLTIVLDVPLDKARRPAQEDRRPDGATRRRVLRQGASRLPRRGEARPGADRDRRCCPAGGCGSCGRRRDHRTDVRRPGRPTTLARRASKGLIAATRVTHGPSTLRIEWIESRRPASRGGSTSNLDCMTRCAATALACASG